jgi:predicted helicase
MAYERLDEALRQLKTDREHAEVTENQRKRGDEKARIRFARIKSAVIGPVFDEVVAHVYGVLHDPIYHETYAINLKREFPRTPFYEDFRRWRDWGADFARPAHWLRDR